MPTHLQLKRRLQPWARTADECALEQRAWDFRLLQLDKTGVPKANKMIVWKMRNMWFS